MIYNGYVGLFEPFAAKTSAITGQATVLSFSTGRGWAGLELRLNSEGVRCAMYPIAEELPKYLRSLDELSCTFKPLR